MEIADNLISTLDSFERHVLQIDVFVYKSPFVVADRDCYVAILSLLKSSLLNVLMASQ